MKIMIKYRIQNKSYNKNNRTLIFCNKNQKAYKFQIKNKTEFQNKKFYNNIKTLTIYN